MDDIINHYLIYLHLLPLFFIGIISGVYNCLNYLHNAEDKSNLSTFLVFLKYASCACVLSAVCFFILDAANFSYEVRVGISALVSFLGIDKAIEYFEKLWHIKNKIHK